MKKLLTAVAIACGALALPAVAANVSIDLAGAVTGSTVTGVGASFAQRFAGQTVSGIGITGSPTNPLALQAAGTIEVILFNPGRLGGVQLAAVATRQCGAAVDPARLGCRQL